MMGDVYIESLVKKRMELVDWLKAAGILLALATVSAALLFVGLYILPEFFAFALLLIFGGCWGAVKLLQNQLLEFETIVTNGDMDVDKVIARSRRKRIFSMDCKNAEEFARYNAGTNLSKYQKVIWACDSKSAPDLWYMGAKKDKGLTAVVFNAPDRVLGAIRPYLPRSIMITVPKPEEKK